MRILFADLYDAKFSMGGAEKVFLELARSMKEDYGEEVACVVNKGDLADQLEKLGIPVTEIYWSKWRTLQTILELKRVLSSFKPDVIHSHHRFTTFLLNLCFKKDNLILHTEHVPRTDRRRLFRFGHFATAVHESIRENLIQNYRVPADKVVTIPNAIRLGKPNPEKFRELKKKFGSEAGRILILCIGRLEEQKGHRYLIEAVERLAGSYREKIRILLVGDGKLRGDLEAQIQKAGLKSVFVFLGHSSDISELLALCDFLVLPSLWEGMPLVILEAYSAGKTVIVTDIPGSRELVRPRETGILVPSRDSQALAEALREIIDHPELIPMMGEKAREKWVRECSFDKVTARYHELYQNLVSRKNARGRTE